MLWILHLESILFDNINELWKSLKNESEVATQTSLTNQNVTTATGQPPG